jgi:adhesin HecA-like repeat protein
MRKHFLFAAFGVAALGGYAAMAVAQATLGIDPTAQIITAGSVVTVDVDIANVRNLYGYQFDLSFNPTVLEAVSSSEGSFLSSGGTTFFISGTNDNRGGTVAATADTLLTAVNGVSGSGELAVFTFDAIGKGISTVAIQNETLLDSNLHVIAGTATGGSITVTSGAAPAPEIDPASAISGLTLLLGGFSVWRGRLARSH